MKRKAEDYDPTRNKRRCNHLRSICFLNRHNNCKHDEHTFVIPTSVVLTCNDIQRVIYERTKIEAQSNMKEYNQRREFEKGLLFRKDSKICLYCLNGECSKITPDHYHLHNYVRIPTYKQLYNRYNRTFIEENIDIQEYKELLEDKWIERSRIKKLREKIDDIGLKYAEYITETSEIINKLENEITSDVSVIINKLENEIILKEELVNDLCIKLKDSITLLEEKDKQINELTSVFTLNSLRNLVNIVENNKIV